MKMAIIISAQESNKYHKEGDLAPFGDTTLLEWKISQCKEFTDKNNIYINSDSSVIEEIAEREEVNFIKRDSNKDYMSLLLASVAQIDADNILSINVTSPFMGGADYKKMYDLFLEDKQRSIVTVEEKREYVYLHPSLGFNDGDRVIVKSKWGSLVLSVKNSQELRADVALIYCGVKGVNNLTPPISSLEGDMACYGDVKVLIEKV